MSEINGLMTPDGAREPSAPLPTGGIILARHPSQSDLERIYELSRSEISPNIASAEIVRAVFQHNPDTFWGIYHSADGNKANATLVGFYSFLHLNAHGAAALEQGTFDGVNVNLSQLALAGERPVYVYVWAIVARRMARIATVLVARALGKDRYGGIPIYCKPATLGGVNVIKAYGFEGIRPSEKGIGDLFRLDPEVPQRPAA